MKVLRPLLLAATLSTAAFGQGRGHGRGHDKHEDRRVVTRVRQTYTPYDRRSDARVITSWYRAHPTEYRRVVTWHRPSQVFFPGYETRIVRSRALPVAFRTYVRPVPYVLISTLPPVRPGWEYVMLDDQVLLVERPTWTVVDIVVRL